jgi:hypothetical protein
MTRLAGGLLGHCRLSSLRSDGGRRVLYLPQLNSTAASIGEGSGAGPDGAEHGHAHNVEDPIRQPRLLPRLALLHTPFDIVQIHHHHILPSHTSLCDMGQPPLLQQSVHLTIVQLHHLYIVQSNSSFLYIVQNIHRRRQRKTQ